MPTKFKNPVKRWWTASLSGVHRVLSAPLGLSFTTAVPAVISLSTQRIISLEPQARISLPVRAISRAGNARTSPQSIPICRVESPRNVEPGGRRRLGRRWSSASCVTPVPPNKNKREPRETVVTASLSDVHRVLSPQVPWVPLYTFDEQGFRALRSTACLSSAARCAGSSFGSINV